MTLILKGRPLDGELAPDEAGHPSPLLPPNLLRTPQAVPSAAPSRFPSPCPAPVLKTAILHSLPFSSLSPAVILWSPLCSSVSCSLRSHPRISSATLCVSNPGCRPRDFVRTQPSCRLRPSLSFQNLHFDLPSGLSDSPATPSQAPLLPLLALNVHVPRTSCSGLSFSSSTSLPPGACGAASPPTTPRSVSDSTSPEQTGCRHPS